MVRRGHGEDEPLDHIVDAQRTSVHVELFLQISHRQPAQIFELEVGEQMVPAGYENTGH